MCRGCEACKCQLIERLSHNICNRSDYSEYSEYYRSQSLNRDILYLGPKDSSHYVHQQLLLLANHLPVHQLHVGAQDKDDLIFFSEVHKHDDLMVVGGWHRSLVIQELRKLLFQPEPSPDPETCAIDSVLG